MPNLLPEFIPLCHDDISEEATSEDASADESENEVSSNDETSDPSTEQTNEASDDEVDVESSENEVYFDAASEHSSDQDEGHSGDHDDDEDDVDEIFRFDGPAYSGPTTPPMGKELHPNMLLRECSFKAAAALESRNEFFGPAEGLGQLFVRGDRTRETRLATHHEGFYEIYWSGNQRHWRKRKASTVMTANPSCAEDPVSEDEDLPVDTDLRRRDRSRSPLSRAVFEKDTERCYDGPIDEGTRLLASARKRPVWSDRTTSRPPHKRRRIGASAGRSPAARLLFPNMPSTPARKRKRRATEDITKTKEYQDWLRRWEEDEEIARKAIYAAGCTSPVEFPKAVEDADDDVFGFGFGVDRRPSGIVRFKPFF